MNATLIFSTKPLIESVDMQLNFPMVRLALDVFFAYMLELQQRHLPHNSELLESVVRQYLLRSPDVLGRFDTDGADTSTLIELMELLIKHYYNEVLGVLNELSREYGVVRLRTANITPYTITTIAQLVHVLPAPSQLNLRESL